jgi:hypothetical protein
MEIARQVLILSMHYFLMRNDPLARRNFAQHLEAPSLTTHALGMLYIMQHALVILCVFVFGSVAWKAFLGFF